MIRYEFTDSSIQKEHLHPDSIFSKEQEIARKFSEAVKVSREIQQCPVCNNAREEIIFDKWGYEYAICPKSWTISLASIPDENLLRDYFFDSELSGIRASREYQDMVTQKRGNLWERQTEWIQGRANRHMGNEKFRVISWGPKYVGWLERIETAAFVGELLVKSPLPPIKENMDEEKADIICLLDVLQREPRPIELLREISERLMPGGLLILHCRAGSGFDILTLKGNSESVFPLDHIFLPSPKGIEYLLEQTGFELLELATPGLLDMTYLNDARDFIPKDQYFQRYLTEQQDEHLFERVQGFLQRNNLSSHLSCVARKR